MGIKHLLFTLSVYVRWIKTDTIFKTNSHIKMNITSTLIFEIEKSLEKSTNKKAHKYRFANNCSGNKVPINSTK